MWTLILTQTLKRKMTLGKLASLSLSYLMQIVGQDKLPHDCDVKIKQWAKNRERSFLNTLLM